MTLSERQQQAVERILEDESLRGDLEDSAATALISWASDNAGAIAADASQSDEAVDQAVQAVRNAARFAAAAGEAKPERVVALAKAQLDKQIAPLAAAVPAGQSQLQPPSAATLPPLAVPDLSAPMPLHQRARGAASTAQSAAQDGAHGANEQANPEQPSAQIGKQMARPSHRKRATKRSAREK